MWKLKETRIAKTILKKKNKIEVTLPNFKTTKQQYGIGLRKDT